MEDQFPPSSSSSLQRAIDAKLGLGNSRVRKVLQSALATASVLAILFVLDALSDTATVATLGASAFVAFVTPESRFSQPRYLIGGYLAGVISGCLCYSLSGLPTIAQIAVVEKWSHVIFGAIAVGMAILLMLATGTEHPPAAGLALGLVLNGWDYTTVVAIVAGVVSLAVLRASLDPVLARLS
jgi:CBS-domain-containing membrane protein